MIVIVGEGRKRFKTTCPRCLCEFEYDLTDLIKYFSQEYVPCPCCKNDVVHYPSKSEEGGAE
jgi:hypothetical protein